MGIRKPAFFLKVPIPSATTKLTQQRQLSSALFHIHQNSFPKALCSVLALQVLAISAAPADPQDVTPPTSSRPRALSTTAPTNARTASVGQLRSTSTLAITFPKNSTTASARSGAASRALISAPGILCIVSMLA
ncbi:hypothetical protein B0J15DRAFT_457202 [Fusarium solani]|uniref:Uncharacterized protein n=1 Tax=Fusarium solani TaxID=169388 RepID=A0A9P9RCX7_FUSSL|nr:uncharacterized protein B0J15DRAFT_457202 [Fusarium solani]KAH7275001.1 hypothetical protein B0J15DRAFT_457202 [Fusarium solani]